jgi:hypothetical protein
MEVFTPARITEKMSSGEYDKKNPGKHQSGRQSYPVMTMVIN